jgi:hypothetical protein
MISGGSDMKPEAKSENYCRDAEQDGNIIQGPVPETIDYPQEKKDIAYYTYSIPDN